MAADKSRKPTPRKRASKSARGGEQKAKPSRAAKAVSAKIGDAKKSVSKLSMPKAAPAKASAPKAAAAKAKQAPAKPSSRSSSKSRIPLPKRGSHPKSAQTPAQPRERRIQHQRANAIRIGLTVVAALLALVVVGVVALFALRNSPVFAITSIEFDATEHVSPDDVQSLARVPEGSTLLNVDTDAITDSLKKNPWVASASYSREFPGTLRITIEEQSPTTLVLMSSGTLAWYLSAEGTWIEPTKVEPAKDQSVSDAALAIAEEHGCLLIANVPSTVDPVAGSRATDAVIDAVNQFQEGFSKEFSSQVACYNAPSTENVSCVLRSGVEVSLGSPTDIPEKEKIVTGYLEQSDGKVVRINVRIPSSPAYREIDSSNVQPGDGVSSSEEE